LGWLGERDCSRRPISALKQMRSVQDWVGYFLYSLPFIVIPFVLYPSNQSLSLKPFSISLHPFFIGWGNSNTCCLRREHCACAAVLIG
jgi:hypothetical protein